MSEEPERKEYGNLRPTSAMAPDELREFSRKGGIASAMARKRRRRIRETLELILSDEYTPPDDAILDSTGNEYAVDPRLYDLLAYNPRPSEDEGGIMTNLDAMVAKQFEKAMRGDFKAFAFIMSYMENTDGI